MRQELKSFYTIIETIPSFNKKKKSNNEGNEWQLMLFFSKWMNVFLCFIWMKIQKKTEKITDVHLIIQKKNDRCLIYIMSDFISIKFWDFFNI